MPPRNTPARSPRSPHSPTHQPGRPLTPLSYLSSPVPDFASTLHTSIAADQADEANVTFLRNSLESLDQASQQQQYRRSHIDAQRDPRQRQHQAQTQPAQPPNSSEQDTNEDFSRRERLQRVLSRLNRLHEPSASSTAAYSNRTPSPNRQSLYDWAPGSDESQQEDRELDAILSELRRQQPDTHPDILRILSQSQLEGSRQQESGGTIGTPAGDPSDMTDALERLDRFERRTRERRERERRARENEWLSLRSRAMLQRARQDGGGSPSSTERMLRYVMERERSGMSEEEERARGSGWFRPSPMRGGEAQQQSQDVPDTATGRWVLPPPAELRERDRQERVEAFRRGYLAESAPRTARISTPPVPAAASTPVDPSSLMLQNALQYLSELRSATRYEDALSIAIDHGLATREFFAEKHDDFVMDLDEVPPLPHSSWLEHGTIFEGHQHASSGGATITHQRQPATSHVEQINPNYHGSSNPARSFDHPPGSTRVTPFDSLRPWQFTTPNATIASSKEPHDQWPVRVVIHSVNPEKMTIQGTMEAYDVPQHHANLSTLVNSGERPRAGKKNAPITTYLEGHIIDLRTHGFLTPDGKQKKRRSSSRAANTSPEPRHTLRDDVHFPSASAQADAQNWLKLPPFSNLIPTTSSPTPATNPAESLARLLLSKSSLHQLNEQYIFMRWKERCFIHSPHNDPCTASEGERQGDQDRGHGLTISGFYYVSLRRSDGRVEGLYFDPGSTPFQILGLRGRGRGWGSWDFR